MNNEATQSDPPAVFGQEGVPIGASSPTYTDIRRDFLSDLASRLGCDDNHVPAFRIASQLTEQPRSCPQCQARLKSETGSPAVTTWTTYGHPADEWLGPREEVYDERESNP